MTASGGGGDGGLRLRLYVAGAAPNSVLARANLDALLARHGVREYDLEVIDCLREPRRALTDGVLVTPTLVRVAPPPPQTIVGSLGDTRRVVAALGLPPLAVEERDGQQQQRTGRSERSQRSRA